MESNEIRIDSAYTGGTVTVRERRPLNAHNTMPANEPESTVSTHKYTVRGIRNAIKSVIRAHVDYSESHGNAAAHAIWIDMPDGRSVRFFAPSGEQSLMAATMPAADWSAFCAQMRAEDEDR